ncbi:MAG: hypothetical protein IPN53_24720 [Comamonadaceae bacterium]|nr:hypothetical protein [Comamonadaceae bacterium]
MTVWIGELQWRLAHGYEFKLNPVLEPLNHIECRDALLSWPEVADKLGSEPVDLGFCHFAQRNSGSDPDLSDALELEKDRLASPAESGARAGQMPVPHTLRFLKSAPTSAPPTPLRALDEMGQRQAAALIHLDARSNAGTVLTASP